jgi:hypothetical protein
MLSKYNDSSVELQRRITLEDHLNQIGDLRRQIEELNLNHKQELEKSILLNQATLNDKKDLTLKYTQLLGENKKLSAENNYMEKALEYVYNNLVFRNYLILTIYIYFKSEQIGKKMQKKIQNLQKKLDLAELKEKTAYACLETITNEAEKIKIEKETYLNLVKSNETQAQNMESKLIEENIKNSKLEDKLAQFKEKAASKLANMIQK